MKRTVHLIAAVCLLICSCNPDISIETFSASDQIRLEVNGKIILSYMPANCQLAFNRQKCEFRVCTDSMSDYYKIELSEVPSSEGQTVYGYVEWTTDSDIIKKYNVTLETVRIQGDRIWLWDRSDKLGAVLKVLE